ncbi:hypothetical protein [Cerasicoccus frondis]|uniref:hypothetical protein n=1 Tax=Cerasicoccus frondis TaxID=490090 RepID=UPI002852C3AE|nr:hypothetical protein [Cerasicoccus frondis]
MLISDEYNIRGAAPSAHCTGKSLAFNFETMPDGQIPVTGDLGKIFESMGSLPSAFVHAEHQFASMAIPLSGVDIAMAHQDGESLAGLELDASSLKFREAWAKLEVCTCCGSPGNVKFFDPSRTRFLMIGAPHFIDPIIWANTLSKITVPLDEIDLSEPEPTTIAFPALSPLAKKLPLPIWALIKLIVDFSKMNQAMTCRFSIRGLTLQKSFIAHHIDETKGELTCQSADTGFQLNLKAIQGFALEEGHDCHTLSVLGWDDIVLFEFDLPPMDWSEYC